MGESRVAEMHVGVDYTGQQQASGGIYHAVGPGYKFCGSLAFAHGGYKLSLHRYVAGEGAPLVDYRGAVYDCYGLTFHFRE